MTLADWRWASSLRRQPSRTTPGGPPSWRRPTGALPWSARNFVINTVSIGGHRAPLTDFDVLELFGVRR